MLDAKNLGAAQVLPRAHCAEATDVVRSNGLVPHVRVCIMHTSKKVIVAPTLQGASNQFISSIYFARRHEEVRGASAQLTPSLVLLPVACVGVMNHIV